MNSTRTSDLDLNDYIRLVRDFPQQGILFRDITPLLGSPTAFQETITRLADHYRDQDIQVIAAAEARGFIFAAPLALELKARFVPVRKPGKLPFDTEAFHYELEYGNDSLEIHTDAMDSRDRVLLVDDLLATGGTMQACIKLTVQSGAEIAGCAFVIELDDLNGREKLAPYPVFSLLHAQG